MVRDFRGDPDTIRGEFAVVVTADKGRSTGGGPGSKTRGKRDARREEAQRKLNIVIEARLAGCSWTECAQRAGYANSGTAYRRFHEYLEKIPAESAERMRRVATQRLDRALNAIWRGVEAGHLPSIDAFLRIEHQRARVLGLEQAPPNLAEEVEPEVLALARRYSGLADAELEAEVKRLDWVVVPGEQQEETG